MARNDGAGELTKWACAALRSLVRPDDRLRRRSGGDLDRAHERLPHESCEPHNVTARVELVRCTSHGCFGGTLDVNTGAVDRNVESGRRQGHQELKVRWRHDHDLVREP